MYKSEAEEVLKKMPIPIKLLPSKTQDLIIGMLNFNDKLILTGSSPLYMLGFLNSRIPNDIDFALSAPLDENELNHLKAFFDLNIKNEGNEYEDHESKKWRVEFNPETQISKPIIQFFKKKYLNSEVVESIKIDIFNTEYYPQKDIYLFNYGTENGSFKLRFLHPSIAIGAKSRFAFDPRMADTFKHMTDLKFMMDHLNEYFSIVRPMKSVFNLEMDEIANQLKI